MKIKVADWKRLTKEQKYIKVVQARAISLAKQLGEV